MPPTPAQKRASVLSDDLLAHLIAVGQVDVLVGLPTLDNASTVSPVVLAIHEAIATFPRLRIALINSDGGSQDGTQERVRQASHGTAELLLASHTLRTMHRVVAPFHGLPGRRAALQTIFATAELLQPRAVLVVDASTVQPSPALFVTLVRRVLEGGFDFVGQAPVRDPREGPLLSQFVRPLLRAVLGGCFEDPLGQQFAVSRAFASHVIGQPLWEDEVLRAGVDLALHAEALAAGFATAQLAVAPRERVLHPGRPGARETIQQVARALWLLLGRHERRWVEGPPAAPPTTIAVEEAAAREPAWDIAAAERSFREGVEQLRGVWPDILSAPVRTALATAVAAAPGGLPPDLWADVVCDMCVAWRARRFTPDQLAGAFVPLYMGRLAGFARETTGLEARAAVTPLELVNQALVDRRQMLAERWAAAASTGDPR